MTDDHNTRDDERLVRIEKEVRKLTGEVGSLRTRLGDRNTTLIFDLDERYMPRAELIKEFVPRKEHEARAESRAGRHLTMAALLFSGVTSSASLFALVTHVH